MLAVRISRFLNDITPRAAVAPLLILLTLLVPHVGEAKELVSVSDKFVIYRDFSRLTFEGGEAQRARVFIDPVRNVSPAENTELHQLAVDTFGPHLRVVADKAEANYLIQIVTEKYVNYAIRNLKRQPAVGYILIGTCKYPIKDMINTCESLTYFYFTQRMRKEIFQEVFTMWTDVMFPSQSEK